MMDLLLLYSTLVTISGVLGTVCDTEPLALPIEDVRVLPDVEDSYMRGIPAKIGSPAQDIVLLPWADLNNTWIYDEQAYCDDSIIWNDRICEIRRGNLYREDDSDTFEKTSNMASAGGASTETAFQGSEKGVGKMLSTALTGTDTFQPGNGEAIKNFPVGIPRQRWDGGYTMLHAMGMGKDSTYLNALLEAGKIGSRVWSIFWGRMWINNAINGSVVLGGYDEEKVIGNNYTAALDYSDFQGTSGCWTGMKITVRDIKVNFWDGSEESILPSNTVLPCCIVPQRQLLLEAPGAIMDNFGKATGTNSTGTSYGLHWSAALYDSKNVFDGDLTFSLDSGVEIRVPNDQYITPFVDIERSGKRIIDKSKRELLINTVGSQPATLGRYFLTAAYLMVNHDANTFTLWQANPSTKSSLVRVFDQKTADQCDDADGVVQPSATPTSANVRPDETGSEDSKNDGEGSPSPSGAVIGGAVAGGVVGLALVGLGIFYFFRRRKQHKEDGGSPEMGLFNQETYTHGKPAASEAPTQEMPGSQPDAAEMQGQNYYLYEMDGNPYSRGQYDRQ